MHLPRRLACAALGLFVIASSAGSFEVERFFGAPQRWPDAEATLYTDPATVPSNFIPALERAMASWSTVKDSAFRFHYGGSSISGNVANHVNQFSDVYWEQQDPFVAALTYTFESSSTIRDRDVGFNSLFSWHLGGQQGQLMDVETIAVHEFGHVLGLNHEEDVPSVMAPFVSGTKRSLRTDDQNGVRFLYPGHVDLVLESATIISGVLQPGGTVRLQARVRNDGGAAASPFVIEATLNPGLDGRRATLASTVVGGLDAQEAGTFVLDATLPTDLPPGTYRPGILVDPEGASGDSDPGGRERLLQSLEVSRPALAVVAGDLVEGELGPGGSDTVQLWLPEGAKLKARVTTDRGLLPSIRVRALGSTTALGQRQGRRRAKLGVTIPEDGTYLVDVGSAADIVGSYALDLRLGRLRRSGTAAAPVSLPIPQWAGGSLKVTLRFSKGAPSFSLLSAGQAILSEPLRRSARKTILGPLEVPETGNGSLGIDGSGEVRWALVLKAQRPGVRHFR